MYVLIGCDKPGVSREKRLPCTSIRNHSSGERTFLLYFPDVDTCKPIFMPIMLQRKSVVMKRETPSGCRGELLPYRRSFNLEFHLITFYLSQTLFNPNKTVVKMFVVMYDLRAMPAGHQTFLRQRTFSVPVRRDTISQMSKKPLSHGRTLRYLVHLR